MEECRPWPRWWMEHDDIKTKREMPSACTLVELEKWWSFINVMIMIIIIIIPPYTSISSVQHTSPFLLENVQQCKLNVITPLHRHHIHPVICLESSSSLADQSAKAASGISAINKYHK